MYTSDAAGADMSDGVKVCAEEFDMSGYERYCASMGHTLFRRELTTLTDELGVVVMGIAAYRSILPPPRSALTTTTYTRHHSSC